MTMLEVRTLSASYGQHPALKDVALDVSPGEIVVILGANGAGKSTLLHAIAGICEGHVTGEVRLGGHPLTELGPDRIVELGVALVPESRGIFGDLTVRENLLLGAYPARAREGETANLDRITRLFPKLRERQSQIVRTMSGGEQQMVAIGRAMMSNPEILMLDEPSLGLSPLLCKELFRTLSEVRKLGIGVLLVEQNARQSLAIADRGYLLENTRIVHEDNAARLATDPAVQKAYLGAGGKSAPPESKPPEPPPSVAPARESPQPRRSADQRIGMPIEDLVNAAERRSAALRSSVSGPGVQADKPAADGLRTVIRDIERAAAAARRRREADPETERKADRGPVQVRSKPEGSPPVVEVYKRPRIEVYRSRPGGFVRD